MHTVWEIKDRSPQFFGDAVNYLFGSGSSTPAEAGGPSTREIGFTSGSFRPDPLSHPTLNSSFSRGFEATTSSSTAGQGGWSDPSLEGQTEPFGADGWWGYTASRGTPKSKPAQIPQDWEW